LNGEGSYEFLANKYGIAASSKLYVLVKAYKKFGDDGINRSRKNKSCSFNFKIYVVELYLSTKVSYQELDLTVH